MHDFYRKIVQTSLVLFIFSVQYKILFNVIELFGRFVIDNVFDLFGSYLVDFIASDGIKKTIIDLILDTALIEQIDLPAAG